MYNIHIYSLFFIFIFYIHSLDALCTRSCEFVARQRFPSSNKRSHDGIEATNICINSCIHIYKQIDLCAGIIHTYIYIYNMYKRIINARELHRVSFLLYNVDTPMVCDKSEHFYFIFFLFLPFCICILHPLVILFFTRKLPKESHIYDSIIS